MSVWCCYCELAKFVYEWKFSVFFSLTHFSVSCVCDVCSCVRVSLSMLCVQCYHFCRFLHFLNLCLVWIFYFFSSFVCSSLGVFGYVFLFLRSVFSVSNICSSRLLYVSRIYCIAFLRIYNIIYWSWYYSDVSFDSHHCRRFCRTYSPPSKNIYTYNSHIYMWQPANISIERSKLKKKIWCSQWNTNIYTHRAASTQIGSRKKKEKIHANTIHSPIFFNGITFYYLIYAFGFWVFLFLTQ